MNLYLLRHAQSIGNMSGDYSTTAHDNLSPLGLSQAESLGELLSNSFSFDAIFVSPYGRAIQTITPYLRMSGRKACIWGDLAEACWQTDTSEEVPARTSLPHSIINPDTNLFELDSFSHAMPYTDEVFSEGLGRIEKLSGEIVSRYLGRPVNVLLATHAYLASRIIEGFIGTNSSNTTWFDFDNCGITFLEERIAGSFFVRYHNRIISQTSAISNTQGQ